MDDESWADDLDRAVAALSQQNFVFAENLLDRWLSRFSPLELDDKGRYLFARSTALIGDLQRDRGILFGSAAAQQAYISACSMFRKLDTPRRVAQMELSMTVITEMSGRLETAARSYERLAGDGRLSRRDRARALLWVGTALSKHGEYDHATRVMSTAIREFEELSEPDDWSVAHQKLALAHRGAGDLDRALRCIDIAHRTTTTPAPMQWVRLTTAQGHVLVSDPATRDDGLRSLDLAAKVAARYRLNHQLDSIARIRAAIPTVHR